MGFRRKKRLLPFVVMGATYMLMEVFARTLSGDLAGFNGIKYISLCGWTSWYMFILGGLCGVFIGHLNDKPRFYHMRVINQCLVGTVFTLAMEFVFGYVLNIQFGMHIWDYSALPFNLMGQICLRNAFLWFLLCPIAIWFDDILQYILYQEGRLYNLFTLYIDLFTLK